jgi:hypothetical protein
MYWLKEHEHKFGYKKQHYLVSVYYTSRVHVFQKVKE